MHFFVYDQNLHRGYGGGWGGRGDSDRGLKWSGGGGESHQGFLPKYLEIGVGKGKDCS